MKGRVIYNNNFGRWVYHVNPVAVAVVTNRWVWCNITLVQYNMLVIDQELGNIVVSEVRPSDTYPIICLRPSDMYPGICHKRVCCNIALYPFHKKQLTLYLNYFPAIMFSRPSF